MSSLGIALLILIFIGIGGVIAYNAWIIRREGRSVGSLLQDPSQPVDINRTEPSLGESGPADPLVGQSADPPAVQPTEAASYFGADQASQPAPDLQLSTGPDGEIDRVESTGPVEAPPFFGSAAGPEWPTAPQSVPGESVAPIETEPLVTGTENPGAPSTNLQSALAPDKNDPSVPAGSAKSAEPVDAAGLAQSPSANTDHPRSHAPGDAPADRAAAGGEMTAAPAPDSFSGGADENAAADGADPPAAPPANAVPKDPFSCCVNLVPAEPLAGSRLLELIGVFNRVGAKPVEVVGQPVDGSAQFATLQPQLNYQAVSFLLLLVNRHGPANAMEYSEFVNRIQAIAEEIDVLADIPDMGAVLQKSRDLDEEIGALDAQVAINVVTEQTMNPGDLQLIAGRLALVEQGNNRYIRLNDQRKQVFSVSLGDKPNHVVLLLDVPRVPRDGQPLREMVECAWKCAQAFEGKMVDDAGQPIDNALFERIERQLDTHYQALDAAGVPAGSAQALRVFH